MPGNTNSAHGGYEVDTAALAGTARRLREAVSQLPGDGQPDAAGPEVFGHTGLAAAWSDATQRWQAMLTGLRTDVNGAAAIMDSTVTSYTDAERGAADAFHAAGPQRPSDNESTARQAGARP
jgi:hypothetical protein